MRLKSRWDRVGEGLLQYLLVYFMILFDMYWKEILHLLVWQQNAPQRPCFLGSPPGRILKRGLPKAGWGARMWWVLWYKEYAILLVCNLLICLWNYPPHLLPLFQLPWSCPKRFSSDHLHNFLNSDDSFYFFSLGDAKGKLCHLIKSVNVERYRTS